MTSRKVTRGRFRKYGVLSMAAIAAVLSFRAASAETLYTWVGESGGFENWADSGNWSPSGFVNGASSFAVFDSLLTDDLIVRPSGAATIIAGGFYFLHGDGDAEAPNNFLLTIGGATTSLHNAGSATAFTVTLGNDARASIAGALTSGITSGLRITGDGHVVMGHTSNAFSGNIFMDGSASAAVTNTFGSGITTGLNITLLGSDAVPATEEDDAIPARANNLTLSGNNSFSGGLTVNLANRSFAEMDGVNTFSGGVHVSGSGTFVMNGSDVAGSGTLNAFTGNILVDGGATATIANTYVAAGDLSLAVAEAGTLTLNGSSNVSGTLTFSATGGSTLTINAASTANALAIVIADKSTMNLNGSLAFAGGLNVSGSGTVILNNTDNSYTGGISLSNDAALSVGNDAHLGALTNNVTIDGTAKLLGRTAFTMDAARTIFFTDSVGNLGTVGGITFTIAGPVQGAPDSTRLFITSNNANGTPSNGNVAINGADALQNIDGITVLGGRLTLGNATSGTGDTGNPNLKGDVYIAPGAFLAIQYPNVGGANSEKTLGQVTIINNAGTLVGQGNNWNISRPITVGTDVPGTGGAFDNIRIATELKDQSSDNFVAVYREQQSLILTVPNSYTGGTRIWQNWGNPGYSNGHTAIEITNDDQLGIVPNPALPDGPGNRLSNNISLRGDGLLRINASMTLDENRGITLGQGGSAITAGGSRPNTIVGGQIWVNMGFTATYNGVISDEVSGQPGQLTMGDPRGNMFGLGTLILGGQSTYTGGTMIHMGALLFSTPDAANVGDPSPLGRLGTKYIDDPSNPGNLILNPQNVIEIHGINDNQYRRALLGVSADGPVDFVLNPERTIRLVGVWEPLVGNYYNPNGGHVGFYVAEGHTFTFNGDIIGGDVNLTTLTLHSQPGTSPGANMGQVILGGDNTVAVKRIEVANNGTMTWNGNWDITNNVGTQGNPTVVVTNGATLELNGINTFSNLPTFSVSDNYGAGTLSFNSDAALGAAPNAPTDQLFLSNGILLATETFTLAANRGIVTAGTGHLSVAESKTLTYDGVISGVNFAKAGDGTLILGGENTFTGTTTINAGVLSISSDSQLGVAPETAAANRLVFNNGSTLAVTSSFTLEATRGIQLGANGGGVIDVAAGATLSYAGIITGANPLTKAGEGTLALSGTSNYSGGTTIADGVLLVGNGTTGSATGPGAVALNAGATLGGAGRIGGALTANTGSVIHPSFGLANDIATTLTLGNSLTTDVGSTLVFNLVTGSSSELASVNDMIVASSFTFNGGTLDFNFAAGTVGSFTIMQYNVNNPIGGLGIDSLTLPATENNIGYRLTVREEGGYGYLDLYRGILDLPVRLPGDANGDGIVDLADLTILARNWKKPGVWETGDFNGDGFVDLADLTILARNWKKTLADLDYQADLDFYDFINATDWTSFDDLSWSDALASVTFGELPSFGEMPSFGGPSGGPSFGSSVPEPTSLALLGLGAIGLLARRRK